jgi:cytochrome c-type biogenesis protein CcmH
MRWGPAVAALAAVLCLAAASDPAERLADPAKEARARALFVQIRCVVCQNESIDDSEAPLAADLRQVVRGQLAEGHTDEQILQFLVQRYGEFVLLRPSFSAANAAAWLTPFLIVLGGVAVLVWRVRRAPAVAGEPLTPEETARLATLERE